MKSLLFLLVILMVCASVSGQTFDASMLKSADFVTIPKKNIDKAKYVILYDLEFVRNPDKPSIVKKGSAMLEVGARYNRFCDYGDMRYDSINDAIAAGHGKPEILVPQMMNCFKQRQFDESIIFDISSNKYTIQRTAGGITVYQYEEDVLELDWQLVEGDTIIRDYHCNKATVSFRGRDYVAWYAPEIEMPFGPYKFNGLPGLVLKVGDTRGHYTFSVCGIEMVKYDRPIYKWARKDIVKTDRAKVRKIYYNFCADPTSAMGGQDNVRISETVVRSVKSKPYNPIELE